MAELRTVADLKPAPYNPRHIDDAALRALSFSLGTFGDISGIVWNSRSGHLVCGHQRVRALVEEHGDALHVEDGALVAGELRFAVRVVDWDELTEKAANIAANSDMMMGEFTPDLGPLVAEIGEFRPDLGALRLDEMQVVFADGVTKPANSVEEEYRDLPACENENLYYRTIYVHFRNADDVRAFAQAVGQPITDAAKYIWYPVAEVDRTADMRWTSEP